MRKIALIAIILLGVVLNIKEVLAYSPHYLPGGDNYLSEDNFVLDGDYFVSLEPFLVKPFTEYMLTISRSYFENENVEVIIEMYDNLELVDTLVLDDTDFESCSGYNAFFHVFMTDSYTNYLALKFYTDRSYFTGQPPYLVDFMLEEDLLYDGYEAYVEGSLIDVSAPYFQNAGTVISYVDTPISITEIKNALNAYDAIDGDVSDEIVLINDDYTPNAGVLGEYTATFKVADSSANETEIIVDIIVVDAVAPVFSEQETIKAVYPSSYGAEAIRAMLSASDNYDGDISSTITLVSDNYTPNASLIGIYEMVFRAEDTSGNQTDIIVNVEVVDETSPIITGTDTISVGYDYIILPVLVKQGLSVIDDYDGDLSSSLVLIYDDYSENSQIIGNHEMRFSISDSSGNETIKTVTINVIDEVGPLVYFNMAVIQVYNDMVLSLGDVAALLKATGELDLMETSRFFVDYDSYTAHSSTPGVYHLALRIESDSKPPYEKELEIRVIERNAELVVLRGENNEDAESFWDRFGKKSMIYGLSGLLLVSNGVWVFFLKKKRPLSG